MNDKTLRLGNTEIRLNDDGTVDEIVVRDSNQHCLAHLEQLSDEHYWLGLHDPKAKTNEIGEYPLHVQIGSQKPIQVIVDHSEDELKPLRHRFKHGATELANENMLVAGIDIKLADDICDKLDDDIDSMMRGDEGNSC